MAIKRRSVLAGGAALWVGGPAILRAQTVQDPCQPRLRHARRAQVSRRRRTARLRQSRRAQGRHRQVRRPAAPSIRCIPSSSRACRPRGIGALWETLCWQSRDEAFTVYGLIAETIEWPEDRSWVAFTLRPQAKWHDGTPITVEDVIWTFDTLKAKGSPNYATMSATC